MQFRRLVVAFLAAAGFVPVAAADPADALRDCLAANVPRSTSQLSLRLISTHRDGADFEHRGSLYWRGSPNGPSDILVCMSYPKEIAGLAYLVHEDGDEAAVRQHHVRTQ